jgi:hypothetical protein
MLVQRVEAAEIFRCLRESLRESAFASTLVQAVMNKANEELHRWQ